jgi:hypothetical protein
MSDQLLNRTGTPFPSENEKVNATPNGFSNEDTQSLYFSDIKIKHVAFIFLVMSILIAGFLKSFALGVTLFFCYLVFSLWALSATHNISIKVTPKEE